MAEKDIQIVLNKSDARKVEQLFDKLYSLTNKGVDMIIAKRALFIVKDMKIDAPVDTNTLRRSIVYNHQNLSIESKAPYSGYVENMTSAKSKGSVKGAYQFFYKNINKGLVKLKLDLNNAIKRTLK